MSRSHVTFGRMSSRVREASLTQEKHRLWSRAQQDPVSFQQGLPSQVSLIVKILKKKHLLLVTRLKVWSVIIYQFSPRTVIHVNFFFFVNPVTPQSKTSSKHNAVALLLSQTVWNTHADRDRWDRSGSVPLGFTQVINGDHQTIVCVTDA